MIKYSAYKDVVESTPETEGMEFDPAYFWLHSWRYPRVLVSLGENSSQIIRVPAEVKTGQGCRPPVTAIAGRAFRGNETVTDIMLPPSVECIGKGAFAGCIHLKRITIPKKVTRIPEAAFYNCRELEDVYYEGSLEEWERIEIVHGRLEVDLTGEMIPGTPVERVENERLTHVPGNEPLFCCNIHFNCDLGINRPNPELHLYAGGSEKTRLFTNRFQY